MTRSAIRPPALVFALAATAGLASPVSAGLVFNFTAASGTSQQAIDGFRAAGALWSSQFTDDMTVNLNINFTSLSGSVIGSTTSAQSNYSYASVRSALIAGRTSASDVSSTAALQTGVGVNMLINQTSNDPNGAGSSTPYLDSDNGANNTTIHMTNANAKALGLLSATNAALDASITFNSNFNFDFTHNASHLAQSGGLDFVGVAAHEIGHSLGFISGVDVLDANGGGRFADNQFTFLSTLDLFRYSTQSAAMGVGVVDWTADNRTKYFSVDGGLTRTGATFATGTTYGDGYQASHWKDNLGLGIMDPTASYGEYLSMTANDLQAFDVIGYTLAPTAVPEPSSLALAAIGGGIGLGLAAARRGRAAAVGTASTSGSAGHRPDPATT